MTTVQSQKDFCFIKVKISGFFLYITAVHVRSRSRNAESTSAGYRRLESLNAVENIRQATTQLMHFRMPSPFADCVLLSASDMLAPNVRKAI